MSLNIAIHKTTSALQTTAYLIIYHNNNLCNTRYVSTLSYVNRCSLGKTGLKIQG